MTHNLLFPVLGGAFDLSPTRTNNGRQQTGIYIIKEQNIQLFINNPAGSSIDSASAQGNTGKRTKEEGEWRPVSFVNVFDF